MDYCMYICMDICIPNTFHLCIVAFDRTTGEVMYGRVPPYSQ